jgi:hypothetical protein
MYGVAFANGPVWLEQRRFISSHLAQKKHTFDEVIGTEASLLVDNLNKRIGRGEEVIKINQLFLEPVNRVLWRMFTGNPVEAGPMMSLLADRDGIFLSFFYLFSIFFLNRF